MVHIRYIVTAECTKFLSLYFLTPEYLFDFARHLHRIVPPAGPELCGPQHYQNPLHRSYRSTSSAASLAPGRDIVLIIRFCFSPFRPSMTQLLGSFLSSYVYSHLSDPSSAVWLTNTICPFGYPGAWSLWILSRPSDPDEKHTFSV